MLVGACVNGVVAFYVTIDLEYYKKPKEVVREWWLIQIIAAVREILVVCMYVSPFTPKKDSHTKNSIFCSHVEAKKYPWFPLGEFNFDFNKDIVVAWKNLGKLDCQEFRN